MRHFVHIIWIAALSLSGCAIHSPDKYGAMTTVQTYLNGPPGRRLAYVSGAIDAIHYFTHRGAPPAYVHDCLFGPEAGTPPDMVFFFPTNHVARQVPKEKRDKISPVDVLMKLVAGTCNIEVHYQIIPKKKDATE